MLQSASRRQSWKKKPEAKSATGSTECYQWSGTTASYALQSFSKTLSACAVGRYNHI